MLEGYARQCGFELLVIRTASVIGIGHGWSGSGGAQKIRALVQAGVTGDTAKIAASQTMTYEYVYAKDLGRAIDLAATLPAPAESVFNIAYGNVTSFDDLVTAAKKALPRLQVEILPGERSPDRVQPVDVSRARELLGWRPEFTLEAALADYATELRSIGIDRLDRLEN